MATNISASLVKELRDNTGMGYMDCKKALEATGGDIQKAILWLREHGMSRTAQKLSRPTKEGVLVIKISNDNTYGLILEVNCETDFVARNSDFKSFANNVAEIAIEHKVKTTQDLESLKIPDSSLLIKDKLSELIAKIGENIQISRIETLECPTGTVVGYLHYGDKYAALVAAEGVSNDVSKEVAREVAMHIVASSPRYLSEDKVDPQELEQEKEIIKKQLKEQNKPENVIEKIMSGQLQKFYKEVCLLSQPFVKDPNISVGEFIAKKAPNLKIVGFKRVQLATR